MIATLTVVLMASLFGFAGVAAADPSADDWYRLRVCESGNNYAINTGNGYYGAYQFDLGTWQSVGGTGYPHENSPATQDALALRLWQARGWGPWACARILGLGNSPASPPAQPTGFVDSITVTDLTALVAGWAYDPSQPATSTQVHIYVNYQLQRGLANHPRDDVNSAFGISGQHGYVIPISLQPGANLVCIFPIGIDPNTHADLGCRTVMGGLSPRGNLDSVSASGPTVTVQGWSFDPNRPGESTPVHVYVNNQFNGGMADGSREDVNSAFGISGQHGFSVSAPLRSGLNGVCVYGIGVDPNTHAFLGCTTVQGPPPPAGFLDSVSVSGGTVTVQGWAFDPVRSNQSTPVHVYVNGQFNAGVADRSREDVNSAFGIGGQHGFSVSAQLQPGSNTVCVYAIGVDPDTHSLLGCPSV